MLKGAASTFQGLEPAFASARGPQSLHDAGNGTHSTSNIGWGGSWQALMLSNSQEPPILVQLSALPHKAEAKQQIEHVSSSAAETQLIFRFGSPCSPWQRPHSIHQDAVLLQVCYQSSTQHTCGEASSNGRHIVHMPLPCSTPCWLSLYRSGKHLQLYSTSEHKQGQQQNPHFLFELQHDSFSCLQPHQCWLMEGPVIILHVQQEQLLFLDPAAAHVELASADAVSSGAPDSNCSAGTSHVVTQLDLDLPSNEILDCVDQEFMQQSTETRSPSAVPVLQLVAGSHTSCRRLTAVQPWRLLHCHAAAAGVQLLLGMQVAVAPDDARTQHHHYHHHYQQQQQEMLSLLVWLEVKDYAAAPAVAAVAPSAAAAAAEVNCPDMEVLHCWSTVWPNAPICAAMLHDQQQHQQLIAIANSTGALQLLSCNLQQPKQQQTCTAKLAAGQSSSTLQLRACGNVTGTPESIYMLRQVVAAGGVHRNVVCILHALSNSSRVTTAPKCVTLLVQQGDELQAIAQVPDAAAVVVPGRSAPLGLLCPWQQEQQQQQQWDGPQLHQAKAADDSALQLAALILQTEPVANNLEQQVMGLNCYAKLDRSSETPAVPQAIGLLQQMPPVLQQLQQQGETSAVPAAKAAASNELRSLQTMLSVLQARWQQEFLDLAVLQQKFTQGRRLAAAAHKHLCQMAADTIQNSSIRQYCSSLPQLDATAAVKAYQLGRSMLQEQLEGGQPQRSDLGGLLDCQLQLTVELVTCRSQLLDDRLQLTVRLKPVLNIHQQQAEGTGSLSNPSSGNSTGPGGSSSWWGPLLQPCHAEVLMWHADVSPLTSQSSWHWDAVEGVITLQAEVTAAALLHVASRTAITSAGSAVQHKQSSVMWQHAAELNADEYIGVARSVAAAVAANLDTAVVTGNTSCSARHTTSRRSFPAESGNTSSASTIQMYSAVAIAACCSKQAVAHAQPHYPSTSQHLSGATSTDNRSHVEGSIMLCSQLRIPATALLHLPAVTVSVQQLLQQQLTPAAPQAAAMQQHAAKADRKAGLHTPLQVKSGQQQQHHVHATPSGAGFSCSELQPIPTGFTNTDVIPPTPCEDDIRGLADGSGDGYSHELVIEDSQPDDEPGQREGHQMQHDRSMSDAADNPMAIVHAVGTPTAAAATEQQRQLPDADETRQHVPPCQRMLLLQGPAAVLQQVPFVLVQQLGFSVPAAGLPAGSAVDMAAMQQLQLQRLGASLQGLSRQQTGLVHIKLQPHAASSGDSYQDVMQLIWFSSELLHVDLMASSGGRLSVLQQLLRLAIDRIQEGGSVKCQRSPVSDQRHASYLAATHTLTETVHLHCKVIEDTLQQVHQQQNQQRHSRPINAAAQSGLNKAISAQGDGVTGVKRPAADGLDAADLPQDLVGADAADGSVLYVDGLPMNQALSSCWVSLYESQADIDLAMSQLQMAGE